MATHELKTAPGYFQMVWDGRKTFEIRYDDRGYQRGDHLVLREWDRGTPCSCEHGNHLETTCERYTGRQVHAHVGCVVASTPAVGNRRGFVGFGYVVLSLCDPQNVTDADPPIAPPLTPRQRVEYEKTAAIAMANMAAAGELAAQKLHRAEQAGGQ